MEPFFGIFVSFLFLVLCGFSGYDCSGFYPEQPEGGRIEDSDYYSLPDGTVNTDDSMDILIDAPGQAYYMYREKPNGD